MQEKCLREYCSSWGVCMRELKFRAWDKNAEYMVYSDNYDDDYFWHIGETGIYVQWYDPVIVKLTPDGVIESSGWTDADCIIMQYTGLKDKNGNEIYEGDIVRCESVTGSPLYDSYVVFGLVEYNAPHFTVDGCYLWHELDDIEIVGNRFENPELVEDTA